VTTWLRSLLPILLLAACSDEATTPVTLNLTDILGGTDVEGFERAFEPREFHFPEDHAAHPGFRNEWWYLTGNLADPGDDRYGYQVTFFRTAISPTSTQSTKDSGWAVQDLWMAHAAVTDIGRRNHLATQRFSRANPGLAGATISPLRVWLDDWRLTAGTIDNQSNDFPWQLHIEDRDFSLKLSLDALKKPVLQGEEGLSQKSATPGNASYYYSYSRLNTTGELCIADRCTEVTGLSWFDREWSTSSLDEQQSGWDWFSLQLDSGEDLMYFQLLDLEGQADSNSGGSWIERQGAKHRVDRSDVDLQVLTEWQSPNGQLYPVRWRMDYRAAGKSWIIQAAVEDQYMDLAVQYWEGAVEVFDTQSMQLVGRGYLEMTRSL
jgi:predicted secreted hydrolase